jgi:plasmid stabilization system protein ParE
MHWLPSAQKDMDEIYDYYTSKSIQAAINIYNGIIDEADLLVLNPNMAAIEPLLIHYPETYRSLVVSKGRYKVVYFVENDAICITRVWNCRKNPRMLIPNI